MDYYEDYDTGDRRVHCNWGLAANMPPAAAHYFHKCIGKDALLILKLCIFYCVFGMIVNMYKYTYLRDNKLACVVFMNYFPFK